VFDKLQGEWKKTNSALLTCLLIFTADFQTCLFLPVDLRIFRVIYRVVPPEVSAKLMSVLEFFINCQFNRKLADSRAQSSLKQTDTDTFTGKKREKLAEKFIRPERAANSFKKHLNQQ